MKKLNTGTMLNGAVIIWVVLALLVATVPVQAAVPLTNVLSVVQDTSVTLRVYNFPSNQKFVVKMGLKGTYALNGVVIGDINSGAGGSFDMTINIPAQLKGQSVLTLRLDGAAGYFAYDWFHNYTGNTPYTPPAGSAGGASGGAAQVYYGVPATNVISVVKDTSVTLKAYNFPANQNFIARIGAAGTMALNGTVVGSFSSGAGGSLDITLAIPDAYKGSKGLSLRLDGAAGYYAYDWFYNYTGNTPYTPLPGAASTTGGAVIGYSGIPTTSMVSVAKATSVIVRTNNFPPNQVFTVRMGAIGTQGINGIIVGSTNSGAGGVFDVTYNIPPELKGVAQIAIRFESGAGYFTYDWFNNK